MTQNETSSQEVQTIHERLLTGIDTLRDCARILAQTISVQDKIIRGFYDAVAHGDGAHRRWLRETIDNHRKRYASELEELERRMKVYAAKL